MRILEHLHKASFSFISVVLNLEVFTYEEFGTLPTNLHLFRITV